MEYARGDGGNEVRRDEGRKRQRDKKNNVKRN